MANWGWHTIPADTPSGKYTLDDVHGVYHIEPPVIPVQERYAPQDTRDPAFEAAYWRFGLELAVELLLRDTNKNTYVASGNNRQGSRSDIPLYLPGNGSLLLAAAMLAAGGGFPQNDAWRMQCEGLCPYF